MKPETAVIEVDLAQAEARVMAWLALSDEEAAALAVPWRTPDVHEELAAAMAASGVPITYVLPGVSGEPMARERVRWANYET